LLQVLLKRNGFSPQFWDGMKQATLDNMPEKLKEAYLKVAPNQKIDPNVQQRFTRMLMFKRFFEQKIFAPFKLRHFLSMEMPMSFFPEHAVRNVPAPYPRHTCNLARQSR